MTDAYYYGKKAEEARKKRGSSNIAAIGKGDPRFNPAMRTRHGAAPDPGRVPLANKGNRSPVQPGNAMQGRWKGGSREWGGHGDSVNHFSIAAILHGTRNQIPQYDDLWWNEIVPPSILFARAVGENQTGEPIKLTLTIGQIGG